MIQYPDLQDKVAVVTGGSRGIGAQTARALAANGVRVVLNGRDQAALDRVVASITETGGAAVAVRGDVTDEALGDRLLDTAQEAFGPVSIVLPFAGGNGFPTPTVELAPQQWRATLDSDLTSTFLTLRSFLPGMIERRSGVVITMASTAGRQAGLASIAYASAKAGLLMFTRHLASEVGRSGIRVNAIAPSAVMNDRMRANMSEAQVADMTRHFPLGRIGRPADIASAVLFLASDAASWITGATLDITGGRVIV